MASTEGLTAFTGDGFAILVPEGWEIFGADVPLAWDAEHDLAVHEAVLAGSGMPVD